MEAALTIGIRFALYADLMLLFGLPLFAAYGSGSRETWGARGRVAVILSVLGLALSALSIVAMTASMTGVPLVETDPAAVRAMIVETPMGSAWVVRMAALASVLVMAISWTRSIGPRVALAAVALGSLAWTGHGAAGEGTAGQVQLVADVAHLFAAAAWIGALVQLAVIVFGRRDPIAVHQALRRFAGAGTVIVAAVMASGIVNSGYLVGWDNLADLPDTRYGQLLLAKLGLFAAMLMLAALNRFRLTPALGEGLEDPSLRTELRYSLTLETGAAFAILALVAWLGTLQPPTSI